MQPMTAIATPGRWPVRVRIWSVTSCRLNSVRPHDGHDTYSVLVLRMREPCSRPKLVVRRKSRSSPSTSSSTPSPRPSTSRPPTHEPVLSTMSSRMVPLGKRMWWMTGTVMASRWMVSNTRRDAWMRDMPSLMLSSTTTGDSCLSAAISAAVSVPSTSMARRVEPWGNLTPPAACALSASFSECRVTAPGRGSLASSAAGTMTCTVTSCRRLMARRPSVSEEGGRVRMRMVSEVAMSLKGMPTASLAPSFLYSTSAAGLSWSALTAENTVPSRCSRPR
mmetsp:Transcript_2390/g.6032  ORF Transcript_2390/g.6032 Transcript_2390/m.6032 type:complete len:278 (-) Transcript_2390:1201-2034(-)